MELRTIGIDFGCAHEKPVVMRSAGILVHSYGSESWVRPIPEIQEPRMGRICRDDGIVHVSLAEKPKPELSNVLDFTYQRLCEFVLNPEIDTAHLRIFEVIRNRTDTPEVCPAGHKRR